MWRTFFFEFLEVGWAEELWNQICGDCFFTARVQNLGMGKSKLLTFRSDFMIRTLLLASHIIASFAHYCFLRTLLLPDKPFLPACEYQ
jgi:hypothetical protein